MITEKLAGYGLTSGSIGGERKDFVGSIEGVQQRPGEGKIDFIKRLRSMELIESRQELCVPARIALHYLSLCATSAAADHQADLCADAQVFADSALSVPQRVRASIATRTLESCLPKNLDQLPIETLIELREELSTERLRYATAVHGIVEEFSKVASQDQLESLQERVADIAKERIAETQRIYRRARAAAAVKALGISLAPSSLAALPSLLGIGIFMPAAIGAGLALGTADFLNQLEKARAERAASPWSYVFQLQKRM